MGGEGVNKSVRATLNGEKGKDLEDDEIGGTTFLAKREKG